MIHRFYSWLGLLIISTMFLGCSSAEEPVIVASATVESTPAPADPPAQPAPTPAKKPDVAKTAAPGQPVAQFTPPFPDRLDLFEPLQRAQSTIRRDDEGEVVELKGFINVDQPKVVLGIDGVDSAIAEGGEKYGVQVISIEPPVVVLQRGRNRWKATLD